MVVPMYNCYRLLPDQQFKYAEFAVTSQSINISKVFVICQQERGLSFVD